MAHSTPSVLTGIRRRGGAALHQLRTQGWAKPFRSVGVLLIGRGAQALFSLVYVAMAARALGPEHFGILVLIHSLMLAVGEVARFQSWQMIQHYGADPLHRGNMADLRKVLKISLILDTIGAVIGLTVIMAGAAAATRLFGIPADMESITRLYGLSVLFLVFSDTPSGLLRLLDRFDLLSFQSAMMPLVRLVGSVVLYLTGAGIVAFLILWFAATAFEHLVLFGFGWREARRRGVLSGGPPATTTGLWRAVPGVWRFSLYTSLNASLQLAQTHLGTLMVGWLLGPAAAGLFRIASQVASVLVKPLRQLFLPAILPELSHLKAIADFKARNTMVRRVSLLTGLAATGLLGVLVIIGRPLITLFAGPEYADAYGVMTALAASGAIAAWAVALEPLLISDGYVRFIAAMRTLTTLAYLGLVYWLSHRFGLVGAGYAAIVQTALISLLFLLPVLRNRTAA